MFKEHLVFISVHIAFVPINGPVVDQHPVATPDNNSIEEIDLKALDVVMDIPLMRSDRVRRLTILDDYIV